MTPRSSRVTFIHGDVWNVNPIALKRVERLFCKNERAVLRTRLAVRRSADAGAGRRHSGRQHPPAFPRCHAQCAEQGTDRTSPAMRGSRKATNSAGSSTARPSSCWRRRISNSADNVAEGARIRAGEALLRKPRSRARFRSRCLYWSRRIEIGKGEARDGANAGAGGGRHCAAAGGDRRWSPWCACASAMNGCCRRASSTTARRRAPPPNAR